MYLFTPYPQGHAESVNLGCVQTLGGLVGKDGAGMLIETLNWESIERLFACCSALGMSGCPSWLKVRDPW